MSRILLLVDRQRKRRLLAELLARRYQLLVPDSDQALEAAFDLCILDGPAWGRLSKRVRARREAAQPIFLPFLLVTARKDAGLVTRHLGKTIDHLVFTPIDKAELLAAVEICLRARRLSVEMRRLSERERKWAEEDLRATGERLKYLLASASVAIYTARTSGHYGPTSITENVREMLGYEPEELIADSTFWIDRVHPEDRRRILTELPRLERGVCTYEYRFQHKDGTYRWMRDEMRLITDALGNPAEIVGYWIDITERKRAEAALIEERHLLHTLMDNLPDSIYFKDGASRFVRINKALAKGFGLSDPAQAVGKTDFDFFTDEHAQAAFADEQEIIRTGQPMLAKEEKETWPDGRETWVSTTKMPLRDAAGNIIGTFGISRDITDRKQAEEALRESQEMFQKAFQASPDIMVLHSLSEGRHIDVNESFLRLVGYRREELVGRTAMDLGLWWDLAQRNEYLRVLRKQGRVRDLEICVRTKSGETRTLLLSAEVIEIAGQDSVVAIGKDITERKQTEEALRASEQRYRLLFERNLAGVFRTSVDGRILDCNEAFARLFGYSSRGEMLSCQAWELYHDPADREAFLARLKNQQELTNMEYCLRRKDGTSVWVLENSTLLEGEDDAPAVIEGTSIDITERKRAEERLRQSGEDYRGLAESIGDVFFAMDKDLRYTYWNKASEKLTGISAKDALGKSLYELFPEMKGTRAESLYLDAMRTGQPHSFVNQYQVKGEDLIFELNVYPSHRGLSVIAKDITERKRAEQALLLSEEKFAKAFRSSPNAMAISTLEEGRFLEVNDSFLRRSGRQREDVVGRTALELGVWVNPDDRVGVIDELRKSGRVNGREILLRSRSGQIRVGLFSAETIEVRGVHCLLTVAEDITERKRAEEALQVSERQLAQAMDMALLAHWEFDTASGMFIFNDRFYRLYGTTAEREGGYQMSPETYFREFLPPEDAHLVTDEIAKATATTDQNRSWALEHRIRRRDGEIRHIVVRISVNRNSEGLIVKTRGVNQDITERKRAEQELHESEERYRSLVEAAPDVIYTLSAEDGSLTSLNPAFETLTGWSRAEWLGKPFVGIVHPDDLPVAVETFQKASRGETQPPYELRVLSKSGEYLVGEFISTPHVKDGKVVGELGIARDITERKRTGEALRASEERFRRIVETAEEGIWMIDAESRTTFANRKMADMLGYTPEEMLGKSLFSFMDEEERALAERLIERRRRGVSEQHDFKFRRQDGSSLWALLATNPVFDEAGRYSGALAMVTDITRRKQLQEQFRQVQKMEAVGRLAGGIAHDFNNLLTAIMGYGQLLYEKLAAGDPLRAYVDTINKAGDRAAALTRQLLAFSRQQVLVPQVLDLNSVVADVNNMLRRLIGEDIDLVTVEGHDLWRVKADPGQIEQVILNLAVNARDAMPQGGKLTIKTANVMLEDAYARSHYPLKPGPYVMLAVSDTGCGMDEGTRAYIFEPFFTTKAKGMGTGLGLATVYGIIKQSRGYIWAESEEGRGTTFTIYLPRTEEPLGAAEEAAAAAPPRGTETVLLVEDEGEVRTLVRRGLENSGYTVLEAAQGEEALQVSAQYQGPIHLLLTDVVMPGMSGRELAQRLTPLRHEMKVLYMSGYADDAILRYGVLASGAAFLWKPFTADAVAQKVREVLGE